MKNVFPNFPFRGAIPRWETVQELEFYLGCETSRWRIIVSEPGNITIEANICNMAQANIEALKPMGTRLLFKPLVWWRCCFKKHQRVGI
jgi:hypothetical protein